MRGNLLEHVGYGMYSMLYYDETLMGFFNTSQEAWLFFQTTKRPGWPNTVSIVSIVVGDEDSIKVESMQTFELEKNRDVYTGAITYNPEVLEGVKDLVDLDWLKSVTK